LIVDLHAHYPMHLDPGLRGNVWKLLRSRGRDLRIRDYFRALGVNLASQFGNYPSLFSGPRVRVPWMVQGDVGVALSVLYSFFDEFECHKATGTDNLDVILRLADLVEERVRDEHAGEAVVVHNPAELLAATNDGTLALVHCVEGGFHLLGDTPEDVEAAVDKLADRGVAYITLAHLIWRGLATGSNAFPQLNDEKYARRCKQPPVGLTRRGEAAVKAMVRRGVVIDISHMSPRGIDDVFDLLDKLDPQRTVPVYATHSACQFGPHPQEYNLSTERVERIAARNGVIGLIFAEYQLYDGLEKKKRKHFEDAFEALRQHIDRIREITKIDTNRHVAIGSDFDGFIKPTLKGLRDMKDMKDLEQAIMEAYPEDGQLICSENALRPLRTYWQGA
jgi:microsomal dipeptidase-like Zn-dependent dipeptidase